MEEKSKTTNSKKYASIIAIILVIVCLIIASVFILIDIDKKKEVQYVDQTDFGPQLNTSSKLSEERTFEDMKVADISVIKESEISIFRATLLNTTNNKKGPYDLEFTFLNYKGEVIDKQETHIDELDVGAKASLEICSYVDIVEAYNFTISKR